MQELNTTNKTISLACGMLNVGNFYGLKPVFLCGAQEGRHQLPEGPSILVILSLLPCPHLLTCKKLKGSSL